MLPTDHKERKDIPLAAFLRGYFPDAFIELAKLSKAANDQHNPGEPMHWAREKSDDHEECLLRHFMQQGDRDEDGQRHTAKVAWRALAMLQLEIEKDRLDEPKRKPKHIFPEADTYKDNPWHPVDVLRGKGPVQAGTLSPTAMEELQKIANRYQQQAAVPMPKGFDPRGAAW